MAYSYTPCQSSVQARVQWSEHRGAVHPANSEAMCGRPINNGMIRFERAPTHAKRPNYLSRPSALGLHPHPHPRLHPHQCENCRLSLVWRLPYGFSAEKAWPLPVREAPFLPLPWARPPALALGLSIKDTFGGCSKPKEVATPCRSRTFT